MAIETFGSSSSGPPPGRRHLRSGAAHHAHAHAAPGALELALLRRSLAGLSDRLERCGECGRTLLLGERVYEYASGALRCELCRERERQVPADSHTVHGPEFGHSIRILDRRPRTATASAPAGVPTTARREVSPG